MATIVLQAAGAYLGGFLGATGAAIGSAAGAIAGYLVDRSLLQSGQRREGPRLSSMQPFTAEEGASLPRLYGAARISGTLIWATRFQETSRSERQGFKGGPKSTTYAYAANAAFALCEGPIAHVRRIWADGREIDRERVQIRIHRGSADQDADPLIEAKQGEGNTPAYRDTAYAVIDGFPLEEYGNRLPQFQFEVLRPVGALHKSVRAVALIPGSTEFGLSTTAVTRIAAPGETLPVNRHVLTASSDIVASLDELQALCPNLEDVAIVAAWFGDDLRAGQCRIRPAVADPTGSGYSAEWSVSGLTRMTAPAVSTHGGGAAYGGSPSDASVIEAIAEVKARGLKATLYPFVMMDIPAGNGLPDPHGGGEQAAYPWRGRITSAADKTAAARDDVEAFCGSAGLGDFPATAGGVGFSGTPGDFGYRRLVLHYAHLAAAAGGVDAFLIGSELRGLTTLRDGANAFPFVEALCDLAADARVVLGPATKITYGADWSEYFGHHPADGSGDAVFHLDPLWAHPAIDAVGIDKYMPLSDWRDADHGGGNPDGFDAPCDPEGLRSMIAGGEGFDWYYPTGAARRDRFRAPIADGAYGKPWVFRYKDLIGWWSNPHHDRIGGVEQPTPTAWTPRSKPIWLTELGCPATDKGANQPNVFPDPKSSESARPYFSDGGRSDLAQIRFLEAHLAHWDPDSPTFSGDANPVSPLYGGRMLDPARIWLWAWDARPFPAFPLKGDVWSDGGNWLAGHWLNGRLEKVAVSDLAAAILADHGVEVDAAKAEGTLHGYVVAGPSTARAALEPIVDLFDLAVSEAGAGLRIETAGRRAGEPVLVDAMVLERDAPTIARTRPAGHETPGETVVGYRDPLVDYQSGSARAVRPGGGGAIDAIDIAGALEAGEAEALAGDRIRRLALQRDEVSFAVPAQARALEPGTVFRLPGGGEAEHLVTSVEEGTVRRIVAKRIERLAPLPRRMSLPPPPATVDAATGPAHALFLDLPLGPSDTVPEARFRAAAHARPWVAQALSASPEEGGFAPRGMLAERATMGVLTHPAPAGFEGRVDRQHALTVRLFSGEFSSISTAQLLNGGNAVAIRAANGAWEIVQFGTAAEIEPSVWRLSDLLRGQLGTDDAMRSGTSAGADVVVLDQAVGMAGLRASEIGLDLRWRVDPAGAFLTGSSSTGAVHRGGIRALTPYSPVRLTATREPAGDVSITWVRRGRIDADSWLAADIPLGEDAESYAVEIRTVAGVLIRAVSTVLPAWTYPAAAIAADFAVLPVTVDILVRQVSQRIGLGVARTHRHILT